jgi:hypothetical protein
MRLSDSPFKVTNKKVKHIFWIDFRAFLPFLLLCFNIYEKKRNLNKCIGTG